MVELRTIENIWSGSLPVCLNCSNASFDNLSIICSGGIVVFKYALKILTKLIVWLDSDSVLLLISASDFQKFLSR